jgi:hypothetical protein
MRSQQELLAVSGYAGRPRDFEDLLRLLDGEIRLITPTDPEGKEDADPAAVQTDAKYYQLTHDYLVPSLREWLTRKQKETRRGRAELLLADRAAVWNARPENRQLPSLLQWFQIRWLTAKRSWTQPQRKMMGKAARVHALRAAMLAVLLALLGWGSYEARSRLKAHAFRDLLLNANINEVPTIVQEMAPYRSWLDRLLHDAFVQAEQDGDHRKQLRLSLVLLPGDTKQVEYLYSRLLDAEPLEVAVIRDALARNKDELADRLWAVVEKSDKGKERPRLSAACALASYDTLDNAEGIARWQSVSRIVTDELLATVQKNPSHYTTLLDQLRPVRARLLPPLSEVYRSKDRPDSERSFATNILADYAADNPQALADLLMDADEKQFAVIYPKLKEQGEKSAMLLTAEIDKKPPAQLPSSDKDRETLAKRQANAAVALLRLNQADKVWPLLRRSDQPDDPRLRSYVIDRLAPLRADAAAIVKRLDEEPDVTIRRALVLSLGQYSERELSHETRKTLLPKLQTLYRSEADPGLHAAVEWLLRQWEDEPWLKQVNDEWAKDKEQRAKRLESIQQSIRREKEKLPPQWYVNGQGQTMVVIPGPVQFLMGRRRRKRGGRHMRQSTKGGSGGRLRWRPSR